MIIILYTEEGARASGTDPRPLAELLSDSGNGRGAGNGGLLDGVFS